MHLSFKTVRLAPSQASKLYRQVIFDLCTAKTQKW